MSAPKGFTAKKQEEYLSHIRAGMMRGAAAEMIGFKRMVILDFIDGDTDFLKLVLDAERERNEHVDEAIFHAAISGSVQAAKAWWERLGLMPEKRGRPPGETSIPPPGDEEEEQSGDGPPGLFNVTPLRRGNK